MRREVYLGTDLMMMVQEDDFNTERKDERHKKETGK